MYAIITPGMDYFENIIILFYTFNYKFYFRKEYPNDYF